METRPIIKLSLSMLDKILELTGTILLLAMWCCTVYALVKSPATVPVHYNASGQPDNYGSKWSILLLPLLGTVIYFGLTVLNRNPHIFNYLQKITTGNAAQQYSIAARMLRFLKLSILIIFCIVILSDFLTATGVIKGLGIWFLPFMFILISLPTIILIAQSFKKNMAA